MNLGHILGHAFSHTVVGRMINAMLGLSLILALPIGSVVGFSIYSSRDFKRESFYEKRFGDEWKARYETDHGSLTKARLRVGAALFGVVANSIIGVWFYRYIFREFSRTATEPQPQMKRRRYKRG